MLELHNKQKSHHVMFFNLSAIETATNSFAYENKLGEGGFGPVYKVNLTNFLQPKILDKMFAHGIFLIFTCKFVRVGCKMDRKSL